MSHGLRMGVEWLDASGVRTRELSATWCRLEIEVDGRPVTLVEDQRIPSTRRAVYCSAYPLAEWIATSWWALRSHVRLVGPPGATGSARDSWRWHDLRAASDGFTWPRLSIHPAGKATELVWVADHEPRGVIQYLGSGRVWLESGELQRALSQFVDAVVDRLETADVASTLLQEEWSTITSADDEEASFCDTAAALGLDPYALDDAAAKVLEELEHTVGQDLARQLAGVSEPARVLEDSRWTTSSLASLGKVGTADVRLLELAGVLKDGDRPNGQPPWHVGYEQARAARKMLSTSEWESVDLSGIVHVARPVPGTNPALQALTGAVTASVRVVPAVGSSGAPGRFMQARALHSALRQPSRASLISAAQTWDAQVGRAFAAELLAPAGGLRAQLAEQGPFVSVREVGRLARHFRAPPAVVGHQLENQLALTVAE